jgi:HPt (histidine-containing phosphotransfer) domain-containing protein
MSAAAPHHDGAALGSRPSSESHFPGSQCMEKTNYIFDKEHLPSMLGTSDLMRLSPLYEEYLATIEAFIEQLEKPAADQNLAFVLAHQLKSASLSVGASNLASLVEQFEGSLLSPEEHVDASDPRSLILLSCKQIAMLIKDHIEEIHQDR